MDRPGREEATGLGVVLVVEEALADANRAISECTFVIQGFGNVGSNTARALYARGGKIIGVSDASTGRAGRSITASTFTALVVHAASRRCSLNFRAPSTPPTKTSSP